MDVGLQGSQVGAGVAAAPVQGVAGNGSRRRGPTQCHLRFTGLCDQRGRRTRNRYGLRYGGDLIGPVAAPIQPRRTHRVPVLCPRGNVVVGIGRAAGQRNPSKIGRHAGCLAFHTAEYVVTIQRSAPVTRRRGPTQPDCRFAGGRDGKRRRRARVHRRYDCVAGPRTFAGAADCGDLVAVGVTRGHTGVFHTGAIGRDTGLQRSQVVAGVSVAAIKGVAGQIRRARVGRCGPDQCGLGLARLRHQPRRWVWRDCLGDGDGEGGGGLVVVIVGGCGGGDDAVADGHQGECAGGGVDGAHGVRCGGVLDGGDVAGGRCDGRCGAADGDGVGGVGESA